ncbi:MAG: hypothetical protein ACREQM_05535, partial [Candidatus Dormibacteraceae bacterium]
ARLIAAGADALARTALASTDPERRLMGARLRTRSAAVASTTATPSGMLASAEEAVTFLRLGPLLGDLDDRARAFLRAGARGLRAALPAPPGNHPERVRLLDRWLAAE